MRTKALLLAAAVSAAGIASIQAQSNVYSINVVGYYNVTIPAGQFRMVANQLITTNQNLNSLIGGTIPAGTIFLRWGGAGFFPHEYADGEWDGNPALPVGDGGFVQNFSGGAMTVTFVGEVPQGNLTNNIQPIYRIKGSMVPQAGLVTTDLKLPMAEGGGDQVLTWKTTAGGGYNFAEYEAGEWSPAEPSVAVGEAFFTKKAVAVNWVRTFSVN